MARQTKFWGDCSFRDVICIGKVVMRHAKQFALKSAFWRVTMAVPFLQPLLLL